MKPQDKKLLLDTTKKALPNLGIIGVMYVLVWFGLPFQALLIIIILGITGLEIKRVVFEGGDNNPKGYFKNILLLTSFLWGITYLAHILGGYGLTGLLLLVLLLSAYYLWRRWSHYMHWVHHIEERFLGGKRKEWRWKK